MSPEQREGERLPILGELRGEIMVFQPMSIADISTSGATVETRTALHLDSLHDIRLTLGDVSVVIKARVAHSRISEVDQDIVTYRTGLEFVEPSERIVAVVEEYLRGVKSERSGV
jgi:hypothetical protein